MEHNQSVLITSLSLNCLIKFSAVESYLGVGRDGKLGVTGEGTLLENAAGWYINYVYKNKYYFPITDNPVS